MRINENRPVSGTRAAQRYEAKNSGVSAASNSRQISDQASVMGIPEEEMTPKVRSAIMTLMEEVERVRRDLEKAQRRLAELEQLADQDTLVPMANRRAFVRELGRMMSFADRYNIPTSLIYFDVNDLKQINDIYGHAAGDAAIVHIGNTLKQNIRDSDIVGRLGGDEFAVVLPNANETAAQGKAATLAKAVQNSPLPWDGKEIPLLVAHGAYSFKPGEDAVQALAAADRKMYDHKRLIKQSAT